MEIEADVVAPCPTGELFAWVRDLDRYPRWHQIVTRAVPLGDDRWEVDLRGRLGPLARTKRLHMARTELVEGERVVFERREDDGRQHSTWRLTASVAPDGDGARLSMVLFYDGTLFGSVLERLLREEIARSRRQLLELVSDPAAAPPA